MAAGEGFEPSHTESESAVLPLHNPAMFRRTKTIIQVLQGLSTVFFLRNGFYFCTGRSAAVKYFFSGLYSSANITAKKISAWRATQALQCGKSMPDILAFLRRHYPDQVRGIGREYAHLSRLLPAPPWIVQAIKHIFGDLTTTMRSCYTTMADRGGRVRPGWPVTSNKEKYP